jgi:CO/xanthine dehydrogenase Mo-binding subunit
VRWFHRIATPSPERQWGAPPSRVPYAECTGAWSLPYAAAALRVELVELRPPVALGFWRAVGIVANALAVEGFVDELAHAARRDPLEFRMAQLGEAVESLDRPPYPLRRLRAALELAAARAGWGAPLPPGRGRGVAGLVFNAQSACATVAEVAVSDGVYRVERLVCAIDCGLVVNPTGLEATVESALAWGLSALDSEITFADGAPRETSLLSYPILPLPRMPRVEVHAVPSAEPPSGAGEIPLPTVAPAVANAIFAACGRRVRRLPLGAEDLG